MVSGAFGLDAVDRVECRTVWEQGAVLEAVARSLEWYDLVFVHNDHNERGKIERIVAAWGPTAAHRLIAVVPVRETEARLLCDGQAIAAIAGADLAAVPRRPGDVERLGDPKAARKAVLGARPSESVRDRLAQSISLDRLAEVPAYQAFLHDLTTALKELRFL